jgi:hypothetical protein
MPRNGSQNVRIKTLSGDLMRWYFRDISDDPSEKELTQQDQFNNDEVALAEAIVRETVQNSTDTASISLFAKRTRTGTLAFACVPRVISVSNIWMASG